MGKIKKNLEVAQDRNFFYADKEIMYSNFHVGDIVFLKVRGKKCSMSLCNCKELAAKFCEPFEVLSRVGPIAYEMDLPCNIKVHIVFHVSLLKKYVHGPNHIPDWSLIHKELEGEI